MDLLKRSELPVWLQQRFGSAGALAAELNVSRQTAHNLFTGRTVPSYENCQRLGLEVMFMEMQERSKTDMENLDDFLAKRKQNASMERANQEQLRLIREQAFPAWGSLQETTWVRASRLGKIDDIAFEWHSYPFLLFGFVAAIFSHSIAGAGEPPRFRVFFGRNPTAIFPVEQAPAEEVWGLELSVMGTNLVWNIPALGLVGATTEKTAEQIIRKLIDYRDKYQAFYASGSWLTK
jgi:hypothetical protein